MEVHAQHRKTLVSVACVLIGWVRWQPVERVGIEEGIAEEFGNSLAQG